MGNPPILEAGLSAAGIGMSRRLQLTAGSNFHRILQSLNNSNMVVTYKLGQMVVVFSNQSHGSVYI